MANRLQDLPLELLYEIAGYLGFASRLALRMSCRSLRANIDDQVLRKSSAGTTKTNSYTMTDLLEIERWPEYNGAEGKLGHEAQPIAGRDFFACYLCLKIRSATKFSNAMMKGKRGKLGSGTIAERWTRFCIDCGCKKKKFSPGTEFNFGGALGGTGFICFDCSIFVNKCSYESKAIKRLCDECARDRAEGRWPPERIGWEDSILDIMDVSGTIWEDFFRD